MRTNLDDATKTKVAVAASDFVARLEEAGLDRAYVCAVVLWDAEEDGVGAMQLYPLTLAPSGQRILRYELLQIAGRLDGEEIPPHVDVSADVVRGTRRDPKVIPVDPQTMGPS